MRAQAILMLATLGVLGTAACGQARADYVWRDGPIAYLPGCDLNYSPPLCQDNGAGFYVSQAWDFPAQLPRANQDAFYVKVYMQGIVSTARYVAPYFVPPAGTVLLQNAQAPVRCFYTERTGGTPMEFTNGPVLDDSVPGGSYWIGGCPQPPYPEATFSGAQGFRLVRNCNYQGAAHDCTQNWPMAGGAAYEFWVPVYVTRAMDGFSDSDRITWPITVLESSLGIQWTYPSLALYASAPEPPPTPTADLATVLTRGAGASGRTLVEGRCSNGGPSTASSVSCQFGGLPAGAIVECDPPSPVAALAAGAAILCAADFADQPAAVTVTLQAASTTLDENPGNNGSSLVIEAPAASADLRTSLAVGTVGADRVRVSGRCENLGPATAGQVTCTFSGLPPATATSCQPAGPQALPAGSAIDCAAEFDLPAAPLMVGLAATSSTPDPTPDDAQEQMIVDPATLGETIFHDGFE